jgi:hypothetical protein
MQRRSEIAKRERTKAATAARHVPVTVSGTETPKTYDRSKDTRAAVAREAKVPAG